MPLLPDLVLRERRVLQADLPPAGRIARARVGSISLYRDGFGGPFERWHFHSITVTRVAEDSSKRRMCCIACVWCGGCIATLGFLL